MRPTLAAWQLAIVRALIVHTYAPVGAGDQRDKEPLGRALLQLESDPDDLGIATSVQSIAEELLADGAALRPFVRQSLRACVDLARTAGGVTSIGRASPIRGSGRSLRHRSLHSPLIAAITHLRHGFDGREMSTVEPVLSATLFAPPTASRCSLDGAGAGPQASLKSSGAAQVDEQVGRHSRHAARGQPVGSLMLTNQVTPYWSTHIPKTSPHICFSSGTDTEPPLDSLSQ